jgi:hypothetical protein
MAAHEGNEFWKQRTKHGRDKLFETPDILNEECERYLVVTGERTWVKKDWVGKDAVEVERETSAPFTLTGLFLFLNIDRKTWDLYRGREDFIPVITRIEQIIYVQKFEGAVVGAFNANIIARELGLKEGVDHTTAGKEISAPPSINVYNNAPPLAGDEAEIDSSKKES